MQHTGDGAEAGAVGRDRYNNRAAVLELLLHDQVARNTRTVCQDACTGVAASCPTQHKCAANAHSNKGVM